VYVLCMCVCVRNYRESVCGHVDRERVCVGEMTHLFVYGDPSTESHSLLHKRVHRVEER